MEPTGLIERATRLQELCITRAITVGVAESLTGGLIGSTLARIPGASAYFFGGVICYNTHVKRTVLGVSPDIIDTHGVVSHQCACALAQGVQRLCGVRASLAVTGEAGPIGGEAVVGTVWIAACVDDHLVSRSFYYRGDRDDIRSQTVTDAISLLYDTILTHPSGIV
jgi:PncC family amidohydrolase